MKNKIKIIFVDIDWTIFSHKDGDHVFDMASIEALKEAQKKGILIFLCTARPYHSVKLTGLLDMFTPDGMILANGGIIIYDNKVIYEKVFDQKKFEKICEVVLKYKLNLEAVEPYDRFIIAPKTDYIDALFDTYYETIPPVEDYHNRHIIACMLFATEEYDEVLQKEFPKGILYYRFHPYGVDVLEKAHDKGEGVEFVLNYLQIHKRNAMAFGDDSADITMFQAVEHSIALANAKEDCKAAAKLITSEVWNSGVAVALKNLKII